MTVATKIGFGKRVKGEIKVMGGEGEAVTTHDIDSSLQGKILLLLTYASREFLEKASFVEIKAVVVPSMHYRDFLYFKDNGDFSLLVLTKFGKLDIGDELTAKLSKLDGKEGELDGEKMELSV